MKPFQLSRQRLLRRCAWIEALERRDLLASSYHVMDVSQDERVTALDALQVVNVLKIPEPPSRFDVNRDGDVTALDALNIINFISSLANRSLAQAEPVAVVTLPVSIRQRDIAEISIESLSGLNLNAVAQLRINWGDGRVDAIPGNQISLPLKRLHSYFVDPAAMTVNLDAVLNNGTVAALVSRNIEVLANSPAVTDRSGDGLTGVLYATGNFTGPSIATRIDPTIDFDFGIGGPDPGSTISAGRFSIRWQGSFTPETSGDHSFFADLGLQDSAVLFINNQQLFSANGLGNNAPRNRGVVNLIAGQRVAIRVEYVAGPGASSIRIGRETANSFKTALPSDSLSPMIPVGKLRGGVLAEQFTLAMNSSVSDFRKSQAFVSNRPYVGFNLGEFAYTRPGDVRASRIRGIVTAKVSGHHTFYLTGSGQSELRLSQGVTADTSRRIAVVGSPTARQSFGDANAGVSAPVFLVAGQSYYLETLHVHNNPLSQDHLAVGWTQPGQNRIPTRPIGFDALRPIVPRVQIFAETSQTNERGPSGSAMRFRVTRDDEFGRDLPVAYTLGGTAVNAVDYLRLSGTVVIPAGQASAEIMVEAVADRVQESQESIVIRLVADPEYQLGSESTRQVIGTIISEVAVGTELLPPNSIRLSSYWNYNASSPNSVQEFRETATDLPFVAGTTGNNAIRVNVNSFMNPWDVAFTHQLAPSVIADGDKVLAKVWARSANPDSSPATVTLRLEESQGFNGSQQSWSVTDEWTLLAWPVLADFNNNASAVRSIDLRLGYAVQTVELAGFSLLKLNADTDLSTLPRNVYSYGGRDWDADWRSKAKIDERTQRSNAVQIRIQDAAGNPIEGAVVKVTPLDSSLPIAMAVAPSRIVLSADPISQTADAARYRATLENYFDIITDTGEAQWGPWLEDPLLPTRFLQWVVDRGMDYHGHAIIWGEMDRLPAPNDLLSNYEQIVTVQGTVAARTWLQQQVLAHVTTGPANAFAGTRPGSNVPLVTWWDVINHPILSSDIWQIVGNEFMLQVIDAARATVHPATRLIINEFDILSNPDNGQSDRFFNLLGFLDSQSPDGRADYDSIGFQGHFDSERLPSIERVLVEMERYRVFNRDFHVTEYDLDSLLIDPQTQADYSRDFYSAAASRSESSLFTLWGYWEGDHWRSEEKAALFNQDWTPRPNGQWLLDQMTARQPQSFVSNQMGVIEFNIDAVDAIVTIDGVSASFDLIFDGTIATIQLSKTDSLRVTTTNDSGAGSLRQAITFSNRNPGIDTVAFEFPQAGSSEIVLRSALPSITDPLVLDATTVEGYSGVPEVSLIGSLIASGDGLRVTQSASGTYIAGLSIHGFTGDAIEISGGTGNVVRDNYLGLRPNGSPDGNSGSGIRIVNSGGNTIAGNVIAANSAAGVSINNASSTGNVLLNNRIGASVDGMTALANFQGVLIINAPDNQIGKAGAGNQISGNRNSGVVITGASATGNQIQGNTIGLNALGNRPLANAGYGVFLAAPANYIGNAAAGAGNTISGNLRSGVMISGGGSAGSTIRNNRIGTRADGLAAVPNGDYGISISSSNANTIGGSSANQGNTISGNGKSGVLIQGATSTGNLLQGNVIGLNQTGTGAIANAGHGVFVVSPGNTIGGQSSGAGNTISGNKNAGIFFTTPASSGNQILGNRIGTDPTGTRKVGSQKFGIQLSNSSNNNIGSANARRGNLVSGHTGIGILVTGSSANNKLYGNRIGTTADGMDSIANADYGIYVTGRGNFIGGALVGQGNLVSGNGKGGILISGLGASANTVSGNRIGTNERGTASLANGGYGVYVAAPNNIIGTTLSNGGNTISGNQLSGVLISGTNASGNLIKNNRIGTSSDGSSAIANKQHGILLSNASGNVIGSTASGGGNIVSGNVDSGILFVGAASTGNTVAGNWIGTNKGGILDLGQKLGVHIASGATGNTVGPANVITYNATGVGILSGGNNNRITRNSIFSNTTIGIDLANIGIPLANDAGDGDIGPNRRMNTPSSLGMTATVGSTHTNISINYTIDTLAGNATYPITVEFFFSNASGQGIYFFDSVRVNSPGTYSYKKDHANSRFPFTPTHGTATATDAAGNSSEFAHAFNIVFPSSDNQ